MTITQKIDPIREDRYRNQIVITDISKGYFPAIISNSIVEGEANREINISLLALEQSPGGTMDCNTGRFLRRENETGIIVRLEQDGHTITTSYVTYGSSV